MGYKSIGRQLQLAREQAGFSQEQLAAKIGCSQSTLSNYEKGRRRIYLAQLDPGLDRAGSWFRYCFNLHSGRKK